MSSCCSFCLLPSCCHVHYIFAPTHQTYFGPVSLPHGANLFERAPIPKALINFVKGENMSKSQKITTKNDEREMEVPSGISLLPSAFRMKSLSFPFRISHSESELLACRLVQNVMACHSASWPDKQPKEVGAKCHISKCLTAYAWF